MKTLIDVPKDILVKLLLTIEKNVKESTKARCEAKYVRENKIYEKVLEIIKLLHYGSLQRCCFPGCKEFDLYELDEDNKYPYEYGNKLTTCLPGKCRDRVYYCHAHDKLHYIKKFDDEYNDEVMPCCDDCLERELQHEHVLTTKDISKVDKIKVRKQLEKDEIRKMKEMNKSRNYYMMSKTSLIEKVFHIGNEAIEEFKEEYDEEMNIRMFILKEVKKLNRGVFSINNCCHEKCDNFMISTSHLDQHCYYYYNDILGEYCYGCYKVYFCENHLNGFDRIFKIEDGESFYHFCERCEDGEKDIYNPDNNLIKIKG